MCVCKIGPISDRTPSFRHQTSRKFFSHSDFPIPYLWTAFCIPLSFVFTKNNNLECRDVLKTVTGLRTRSVSGHTLRTTKHKWSTGFMVLDVSYSRVLGQRPTFYCPLLAVSCPEVWARMYYVSPYLYSAINVQCSYEKTK